MIGVVISTLYRQGSERGFQDLLRAQLYNVINSIVVNDKSVLAGSPQLGDLRFSQPQTGWYWIVEPIGEFNASHDVGEIFRTVPTNVFLVKATYWIGR